MNLYFRKAPFIRHSHDKLKLTRRSPPIFFNRILLCLIDNIKKFSKLKKIKNERKNIFKTGSQVVYLGEKNFYIRKKKKKRISVDKVFWLLIVI